MKFSTFAALTVFCPASAFLPVAPQRRAFAQINADSKAPLSTSLSSVTQPGRGLSLGMSAVDTDADIDILAEADTIFDSIDVNKDGSISFDELRNHLVDNMGYSTDSVRYLFTALDSSTDGAISREEMRFAFSNYEAVALYMTFGLGGSEVTDGAYSDAVKQICRSAESSSDPDSRNKLLLNDLADLIFDMIDTDKSGEIDTKELRDHFERSASKGEDSKDVSVDSIFTALDMNSDGVISKEEMRDGFKQYDHKTLSKALGLRVYRTAEV